MLIFSKEANAFLSISSFADCHPFRIG